MSQPTDQPTKPASDHDCGNVPLFHRLSYHYGQMLGARDFQSEQDYFRHKMLLQNRCLHGYGVVCGLEVEPVPPGKPEEEQEPEKKQQAESQQADAQPQQQADEEKKCPSRVLIRCGFALDREGHELVVREPLCVELWEHLSEDERNEVEAEMPCPVYVVLCYHEVQVDKKKVDLTGQCLASNTYTYAKICESVCVRVTLQPPPDPGDDPCDPCCSPPEEKCLWLARIDKPHRYGPIHPHDVHNEVRRPLGLYLPTTITGINWVHGAVYPDRFAQWFISEEHGLRIRFSRPVKKDSVHAGVVDVCRITNWNTSPGTLVVLPTVLDTFPAGKQDVQELRVRVLERYEKELNHQDRVLITLRTDFILDKCGRPVDGNHVGGRVSLLDEEIPEKYATQHQEIKAGARSRAGDTSGNGIPGGVFESWFRVEED